jgi:hypothetical protein
LDVKVELLGALDIEQPPAREAAGEVRLALQQFRNRTRCFLMAEMPECRGMMGKGPVVGVRNARCPLRPFARRLELAGEDVRQRAI